MNPPPRTLGVQSKFRTLIKEKKKKQESNVDQRCFYYVVSVMREGVDDGVVFNKSWHNLFDSIYCKRKYYVLITVI